MNIIAYFVKNLVRWKTLKKDKFKTIPARESRGFNKSTLNKKNAQGKCLFPLILCVSVCLCV